MMRRRRNSGHAVIETALMAPWIFMLFIAIFDFGFYAYAGITTANGARVAALQTSAAPGNAGNSAVACAYALEEMRKLPNIGTGGTCPSTTLTATALAIVCSSVNAAQGCPLADLSTVSRVTVTYQTIPLFPVPGMAGQFTIVRQAFMRARTN
jgi:Flp pilus assembly protein TadG